MEFTKKYNLILKTVQENADRRRMFTVEDLVSEAWLRKEVREAEKAAHVVQATKDACVDFLRRWHKTGTKDKNIKVVPMSVLVGKDEKNMLDTTYECDLDTPLLQEELMQELTSLERTIVEARMEGMSWKEIAEKLKKPKSTVYWIHKQMQRKMCEMKKRLLGD